MQNRAIFLDRDGTINEEVDHLVDIKDLNILPNVTEAIKAFNSMGFLVIIITNQSVVGRGYLSLKKLEEIHQELVKRLKIDGAIIDDIFYCPHHPDDQCQCRKPKPGLIYQAKEKYDIDIKKSYLIGDNTKDIQAAQSVGCKCILVKTGYGRKVEHFVDLEKKFIVDDLLDALNIIKKDIELQKFN